ncbi:uncharacterized protein MYCFIDRAFT_77523 [Pseudocercospora fijiensis CIRAD86]|uniref:Tubby C-terminal domain-containing protein n=1 Tax=Pseudocercospora fijiensis (strain CIRAD86) TaxID=383855 RepID=M3APV1_PSEFD|nr:uncharacterized protein MYCFIDRAFT_77523 [Pseudocercospora fijiensis CIRAD86]EME86641.1 hypothetical protein MYCFIDRAFT_77523 [Pseudocercospora fijiensis CIRAD86]
MADMQDHNHARTQSILQPPPSPLTIGSNHISEGERILNIICPARYFTSSTCTITDEHGELLFKLEIPAAFKSYSVRRTLKDTSDRTLLVLRHPNSKIHTLAVETETGTQLCLIKDHGQHVRDQTAQIHFGECYATIDIRDVNAIGTKTLYQFQGQPVAELEMVVDHELGLLTSKSDSVRTAWRLRIAPGVDMALFVALAFARIEISQSWRR